MKISGIDFPGKLLDALRNGELVVFAGAGVSMGEPANLPSFKKLAQAVAQGTGEALKGGEPEDQFLGRLNKDRDTKVHERSAQELSQKNPKPTDLHRDLLRLYSKQESTRIVTTNFDLLFEDAADGIFDHKPEVFRAPALPLGNDFNGIVHVHGSISHPSGMVLTDADFGRAYLTEGWARRFLVELFRSFTVLFTGYSHDDTVMNYLARALPESEAGKRFALTDEAEDDRWRFLGIESIVYPRSPDHKALYKGVHGLAKFATRGILDWQREITEIAGKPPSLDEEETDLIDEALSDPVKTRFFTNAVSSPEWIDWLDGRKHLDGLFGAGELGERDRELASWLAYKFAREHADALFLLIGRHGMRLHPDFWLQLGQMIGMQEDPSLDAGLLSRWVSLLLSTAPANSGDLVLPWLVDRCIEHDLTDSLIDIFNVMAATRLEIRPSFHLYDDNPDDSHQIIRVELKETTDDYRVIDFWENGLKQKLDHVADPLLARVVAQLTAQHRTLRAWQAATRDYDPASFRRSAIEPHEQDRYPEAVDVLIDAVRDCLEWLVSHRPAVAARWCDQLAVAEAPLLRRLAVHTLSMRQDLNPNEKIDWLLTHMDLHDVPARHEMFRVLKQTYPDADPERRRAVIEAVRVFRWPREENKELRTAQYHFNWLHWLHNAAPDCALAQKALDDVLARYPKFQPSEHPDLLSWHGTSTGYQSPWTVEELLSRPAKEWADKLLSFQPKDTFSSDRDRLWFAVEEATRRECDWGIDLVDALATGGEWDSDLWAALMRVWCETELDEQQCQKILSRLRETELRRKHPRPIADFLYALVKNGGRPYAPDLLQQANEIAANLWRDLDRDEPSDDSPNWLDRAINHAGGVLALYWLEGLSLLRKQQDPKPDTLSGDYLDALSGIVQDKSFAGKLGRSVLASEFSFLLTVDEQWTKENLLPLFKQHENVDDYLAVWDGFLYSRLNPPVAELMGDTFLEAVQRIESDFSDRDRRDRFIEAYTTMLSYFAENPLDAWIPGFFDNAGEEDRKHFALKFGRHFYGLNEERQQEWWRRWLKRYWENRLNGAPRGLDGGEVKEMLNWLPYLQGDVFPEAVDLAVQMPQVPLQRGLTIYRINNFDLWQSHPEAVAKLLIHLGGCDSPPYVWSEGKELIDKLLASNISEYLKEKLEELRATLGLQ